MAIATSTASAWRAAQIAAFYNDSLLVIESNTLETHDKERQVEGGDQSQYILNQISDIYPNLYARKQSEDEIREGAPRKYGFHTNVATKPMIISTLVKVIRERLYIERDKRCLDEYDILMSANRMARMVLLSASMTTCS